MPVKHFTHCPARFDGVRSREVVGDFPASTDFYKTSEGISNENALLGLPLLLQGAAYTWWCGIKSSITTWDQAKEAIRTEFAPKPPAYQIYLEVFSEKQGQDMPTGHFISQKRALLALVDPPDTESRQLDFIFGLIRSEIRDRLSRENLNTFADLLAKAREIEAFLNEKQRSRPRTEDRPRTGRSKERPRCSFCNNFGHDASVCRKKLRADSKETTREPPKRTIPSDGAPGIACYGCGRPGVFRRNCPACNKISNEASSANVQFCFLDAELTARHAVEISIGTLRGTAYIDTGAKTSLASLQLHSLLRKQGYKFTSREVNLIQAEGECRTRTIEYATVPVTLKGRTFETTFIVIPGATEAKTLLGIDFIKQARMVVNHFRRRWHFEDNRHEAYGFIAKDTPLPDVATAPLAPEKSDDASIEAIFEDERIPIMITPLHSPEITMECDLISELAENYGPCLSPIPPTPMQALRAPLMDLPNTNSRTEYMFYDAMSAVDTEWQRYLPEHEINLFTDVEMALLEVRLRSDDEGHVLSNDERASLNKLLVQNADLFAAEGPPTPFFEHRIETGDQAPISCAPYRLSRTREILLRQEVDSLLQQDIIEECESAWAAPVVLVPKPDGKVRLCIDYRMLNSITKPDVYPLPHLDSLLHSTQRAKYISVMDLRSGYYQVQVHEADRDKTSFITPFGLYRFKRMPFGLRNAPATFQRMMDRFKIGLSHTQLLVYLDDIILLSETFDSHLADLERCFKRMREFHLRMHRQKCRFGCEKVAYLGHLITATGIQTNPDKVHAIVQMMTPVNVKQLLTFLQTCNWYRRFIANFALISKPLTDLTKREAAWKWELPQQEAFEKLKGALASAPILKQATPGHPYVLRTDASSYALGAVLLQGEGPDEKPIEYASRLLSPPERNYSTTEREALAVVWAVQKFRGYLEDAPAIIITDHQPLRWLMSLKSPSGRLARWALQLQPYNIKIEYAPGKANVVADTLSRPPGEPKPETCPVGLITVDLPRKGANELRTEQLQDEELKKIIDTFEHGSPEEVSRWSARGYLLTQGVLYRYTPEDDNEEAQLVVPSEQRPQIMKDFHDDPTAGHYGAGHTYFKISRKFYWPGMRRTIQEYIKKCSLCQRYKPENQKPAGLLQTPVMQQRFEIVSMDLFGPLPKGPHNETWIYIIEDCASRWVELFPLEQATAENCATIFIREICFRYGIPRSILSDNGTQFISAVMQQICLCFDISQKFTPVYHPAANMVERKNRDLKTQLSILVGNNHTNWPEKLPTIRFAMNSTPCSTTGFSAAYLTFGRELRTLADLTHDLRNIVQNENFVPEVTPKLLGIIETWKEARENQEQQQDRRKETADQRKRAAPIYKPGDLVLVTTHPLSKASQGRTSKFAPKRDGPYVILNAKGPCSYEIAAQNTPTQPLGTYHVSALRPITSPAETTEPIRPIRRRGRPRKNQLS